MLLVRGFGGEQDPHPERVVAFGCCVGVMGRQRARRLVIPMSAQRNGYRAAGGTGVAAGIEDDDGVVGVCGASHVTAGVARSRSG